MECLASNVRFGVHSRPSVSAGQEIATRALSPFSGKYHRWRTRDFARFHANSSNSICQWVLRKRFGINRLPESGIRIHNPQVGSSSLPITTISIQKSEHGRGALALGGADDPTLARVAPSSPACYSLTEA